MDTSSVADREKNSGRKGPADPHLEEKVLWTIKKDRALSAQKFARQHGFSIITNQNIKERKYIRSCQKKKTAQPTGRTGGESKTSRRTTRQFSS